MESSSSSGKWKWGEAEWLSQSGLGWPSRQTKLDGIFYFMHVVTYEATRQKECFRFLGRSKQWIESSKLVLFPINCTSADFHLIGNW